MRQSFICVSALVLCLGCAEQEAGEGTSEATSEEGPVSVEEEDTDEPSEGSGAGANGGQGLVGPLVEEDVAEGAEADVAATEDVEEALPRQWNDTQHLILETAKEQYPTYKLLHQYAVGPGCGPITGVCHNTKEYPDLHTSANMLDTIGVDCNVLIDGPAVTENVCERQADQLIITNGADVGFLSDIANLEVVPEGVECGEDPSSAVPVNEEGEGCLPDPEGVTWENGIQDLMIARCGGCHASPPNNAPFSLVTYEEMMKPTDVPGVFRYDRVLPRMDAQTMPPTGGNTDEELQLVVDWLANCHSEAGEEVFPPVLEGDGNDALCILLRDEVPLGMSPGVTGVNFSILRKDKETNQNMVIVEYQNMLQTKGDSTYVRFPGFGQLTDQEQGVFLYTVIPGDPNGDGVFGAETADAGKIIMPGYPERSYFVWRSMGWGTAPQMPLAGEPLLDPAQLAVMCWIKNLVPGDAPEAGEPIKYANCYNLLEHFVDSEYDGTEERNH